MNALICSEYFTQFNITAVIGICQYFCEIYCERSEKMLYENIKKQCCEKEISVNQLEKELGFARSSLSKWSKHSPSVSSLKKVADYLGITVDELVSDEPAKEAIK